MKIKNAELHSVEFPDLDDVEFLKKHNVQVVERQRKSYDEYYIDNADECPCDCSLEDLVALSGRFTVEVCGEGILLSNR